MIPLSFFLLFLFVTAAFPSRITVTGISNPSLDALLFLLRSNGHALLANSIATSDLVFDVLSLQTLTLLAPPDPSLFSLDMTLPPPAYLSTLRLHVIPSSIDLNPSSRSFAAFSRLIPTLLPSRSLRASFSSEGNLLLDGVPVLLPRVYHSRDFSVYRLRGTLPSSPPPTTRNFFVLFPPALSPSYSAPVGAAAAHQTPAASPSYPPASQEMPLAPSVPPAGSLLELLYSPVDQSSPFSAREVGEVPSSAPASHSPVGSFTELLYSAVYQSSQVSAPEARKVPPPAPASQDAPSVTPAGSFPEFLYFPVASSSVPEGNWRVGFNAGGAECGPSGIEMMLCWLRSVSDASVNTNSRNDVVETDGRDAVDDYVIRRYADLGF